MEPLPTITWADKRLQDAYCLIEAVMEEQHPESDAGAILFRTLEFIENADCELEKAAPYRGLWAA